MLLQFSVTNHRSIKDTAIISLKACEESESHFKYGFSAGLMFSRKPMNKCSRRKKNG